LGEILADGIDLDSESGKLRSTIKEVRVYPLDTEPGFATLEEAIAAFTPEQVYPEQGQLIYVGDAVVDVKLEYIAAKPVYQYQLASSLNPGLPGQDDTANLVLDYGPGGVQVYRARGLLTEPIVVSRSAMSAFATFVKEGMRHILEGIDHVLFVLCLVAGALSLKSLLWRVTGFTIGHSITLSAGFFGFVPSGNWFVPLVETGIALSIVYAAAVASIPRFQSTSSERITFFITSFIGLIHGLGFSFVLHNILKISSPNIWQSLLAFNLGIELGQLLIILAAGMAFWFIGLASNQASRYARMCIAAVSGVIAVFWVFERTLSLVANV
jgi:hypothetical protein